MEVEHFYYYGEISVCVDVYFYEYLRLCILKVNILIDNKHSGNDCYAIYIIYGWLIKFTYPINLPASITSLGLVTKNANGWFNDTDFELGLVGRWCYWLNS